MESRPPAACRIAARFVSEQRNPVQYDLFITMADLSFGIRLANAAPATLARTLRETPTTPLILGYHCTDSTLGTPVTLASLGNGVWRIGCPGWLVCFAAPASTLIAAIEEVAAAARAFIGAELANVTLAKFPVT